MPLWDADNRLADDKCAILSRLRDNESLNAYRFYDPYGRCTKSCTDRKQSLTGFASQHPNLRFQDGFGISPCEVDGDSKLKHESKWTNAKERQQLPKRVFTSAPDLSRGEFYANTESVLISGQDTSSLKHCSKLAEVTYDRFVPGVDTQCAEHIIPPWTWGGDSSRDITRSKGFLESIGYQTDEQYTCYKPVLEKSDDSDNLLGSS